MKIRIGPAGLGSVKDAIKNLEEYHKLGFRACEIAFTYNIYINNEKDAREIGRKAKSMNISLSIHAPYYINLNSLDKQKVERSKEKIISCCRIGNWLGAKYVVFHPGYYTKDRNYTFENIKNEIKDIMKKISDMGFEIELAPETMGKINVFGSVEEISALVKETGCSFCIDFAHLLARDKNVNYKLINKLFPQKKWHTHFSGIIYGEKGERSHRETKISEWKELFSNLPDKEITIINESPTMINDCINGIKIYNSL